MTFREPGFSLGFRFKRLVGTAGWGFQLKGSGRRLERAFDTALFRTIGAISGAISVLRVRESDFAPSEQWMKYAYYLAYVIASFLVFFLVHWFVWGKGSR